MCVGQDSSCTCAMFKLQGEVLSAYMERLWRPQGLASFVCAIQRVAGTFCSCTSVWGSRCGAYERMENMRVAV